MIRGKGRYMADAAKAAQVCAVFVRTPYAAGGITSIDTAKAVAAPGVLAVLTGADMAGLGSIALHPPMQGRAGATLVNPMRPPLADGAVRHIGEAVAMVVAETAAQARDAAELVEVGYVERTPIVDLQDAAADGSPLVWPQARGNLAIEWQGLIADPDANARRVEAIIAEARLVARASFRQQRILINSLEPRGATGEFDAADGSYTLRVCTQGVRPVRDAMAAIIGVDATRMRILTDDVGGAFGLKVGVFPEYAALLVAARRLGRPVHWMSTRSEAFLSDHHARDTISEAELAMDETGRFLALRVRHLANMGAYLGVAAAKIQTDNFIRCLPGCYDIPLIDVGIKCVFTNTVPTGPYRGAGRPEASYLVERIVEEAARISDIDAIELRRRNFVAPAAMPYTTAIGTVYDSGKFEQALAKALDLAAYRSFEDRRRLSQAAGRLRGIGISSALEHSGSQPTESCEIAFPGDGRVILKLNVQSTGQGHATTFGRLVAERLGVPAETLGHRHGDSRLELPGYAAVGSRSAMTVSHAAIMAAEAVLAKARKFAATMLQTAEVNLVYGGGCFHVVSKTNSVSLFEVADWAAQMKNGGEIGESLDTRITAETPTTFPNSCHIAEVEIDPDTGAIEIVSYAAVDDCGSVLDPTLVAGQIHGGIAQGIGQALMEQAIFDRASGQLITGSFMDYSMPRAGDMPAHLALASQPVPATTNPAGVKGIGEMGSVAAISAVMNAIADAIPCRAGREMEMPATPEKIWRACKALKVGDDF
ncbi:xanthine dehydrogenase family protein molybdopterin-binding subunit [Aminobacter sp. SS-2016]|uniref:xanthine dehydrogenase family protein molybdopterin-binding subunit n=1 Tax=Aminobacter sp. Y103A TaxID=1870862 RepID=UPI0025748DDD|nr:xanthine dehydrogenase family protein molybdopterin-binding subunit [Aminobacter sp. SS-2016]